MNDNVRKFQIAFSPIKPEEIIIGRKTAIAAGFVIMCGMCKVRPRVYESTDNLPRYSDLCSSCIIVIPYNERNHYKKVKRK